MAQNINFPRRNLPGSAENWGRQVEAEVAINRNNVVSLAEQVNNASRATSGQLAALSEQINFLNNQQVSFFNAGDYVYTLSPAGASGPILLPFNPTFDIRASVTAPPSGRVRVDLNAIIRLTVLSSQTGGASAEAGLQVTVTDTAGDQSPRSSTRGITSIAYSSLGTPVDQGGSMSSFFVFDDLSPGKEYIFETQRQYTMGISGAPASATGQTVEIGQQGLSITNLR